MCLGRETYILPSHLNPFTPFFLPATSMFFLFICLFQIFFLKCCWKPVFPNESNIMLTSPPALWHGEKGNLATVMTAVIYFGINIFLCHNTYQDWTVKVLFSTEDHTTWLFSHPDEGALVKVPLNTMSAFIRAAVLATVPANIVQLLSTQSTHVEEVQVNPDCWP